MNPFFYFLLSGILLIISCSQEPDKSLLDDANFTVSSINIALKPNKNLHAQREDEKILGNILTQKLGLPVNITTPSSKSIIEAGLENKTIDLGYVSSSDAISFADNNVAEILVAGNHESLTPDGKEYVGPFYFSVWLSLKEKPYSSIKDLKGKRVAFASRTSTSGFLIPSWDLIKRGLVSEGENLSSFFGENNIFYGNGYVSAVEQVLEGKAEAAAVSYYVFEKDKHLTPEQRKRLKVIQRQGPVASHTFCVRSSLPTKARNALQNALLELSNNQKELSQSLFGGTLAIVDPIEHLKAPREAKRSVNTLQN